MINDLLNYIYYSFAIPYSYVKYEYFRNDHKLVKYDRGNFVLTYKYNDNIYKIMIKHSNLPNDILYVTNHDDEDITEQFYEILGPGYDFHNVEYTPSYFNTDSITIQYMNDESKTILNGEIIKI